MCMLPSSHQYLSLFDNYHPSTPQANPTSTTSQTQPQPAKPQQHHHPAHRHHYPDQIFFSLCDLFVSLSKLEFAKIVCIESVHIFSQDAFSNHPYQ